MGRWTRTPPSKIVFVWPFLCPVISEMDPAVALIWKRDHFVKFLAVCEHVLILLRVPWTARSNRSILKKISPEHSLEELMLKLRL